MDSTHLLWFLTGCLTPYVVVFFWGFVEHLRNRQRGKHEAPRVVGHVDEIYENENGVTVVGTITDEVFRREMSVGSLSGLSIGYKIENPPSTAILDSAEVYRQTKDAIKRGKES